MRFKVIILVFALLIILGHRAFCDELGQVQTLFFKGNAHYSEDMIDEAISDYEKACSLGYESGPLYYNLGNTYFKKGLLGKAIANYLRAQKLTPDDADLISNLRYAQSLVKGGVIATKGSSFSRILFSLAGRFSLNRITLISIVLYFLFSITVILFILLRNFRKALKYIGAAVLLFLIISTSLFIAQFYNTIVQKEAVVVAKEADSKFEPIESATTFFMLNEGESVTVVASKRGWLKIRRPDNNQGWVKELDLEFL